MDKIRIQIRGCLAGRQLNTLFSMSRRYHRLKVTGHYSRLLCPLTFISYLYFYANQYLRKTASVGSHTFNNYVCMSVWSHSHLHVKQRHGQALLIHICPGHTISIQSRFLPLLRSIFQSFFYKFLCCFPPPPPFLPVRVSFYGRLRTSPFLHSEHVPPPFPSSLSNSIHDVITSCPLGDFYICWHMFPSNSKDSSQAASKHWDFPMHPASWCYEAGRQA